MEEGEIERKLKKSEELEKLILIFGHELKSPVNQMNSLLTMIKTNPENSTLYLQKMEKSLNNLRETITDLIKYGEHVFAPLELVDTNLYALLIHCKERLSDVLEEQGVTCFIEGDKEVSMNTDAVRFCIVIMNLIGNSARYSDPNKSDKFVRLNLNTDSNKNIVLSVKDNGLGIEKECLPFIFKMFYRCSTSTDGSGLGLFITKEIVEKLGGSIGVESELDKGSTFTLSFSLN